MASPSGDFVPVDPDTHQFIVPTREVLTPEDINSKWVKSEAYRDLLGFICFINDEVKNKKLTDPCHMSKTSENLLSLLSTLDLWVDEVPPTDQPQRFGNKAFRDWFKRLQEGADALLKDALEEKYHKCIPELRVYLVEGVGNSTRIDYGTGHEMSFIAFLCCLFKVGACVKEDSLAIVCKVFARYIEVMRKVQMTYRLEPAGSQGVWNLDDYQFVPFLWGSAQLLDHPRLKPKSFLNEEICVSFAKDYMFLGCILYIHKVKTGPFAEHSNQLWNISGVSTWGKVNQGLIKMYCAEVLSKFPIIQHFLFGSLLRIVPSTP
jgi:serine/threonine-protein phosphatase 2A activator